MSTVIRRRGSSTKSEPVETGYELSERVVSHHNQPNDAWVIHNGSVYDITLFLSSHPGGEDILLEHLGSDISETMDMTHEHSKYAYQMLEKYRIGSLTNVSKEKRLENDGLIDWNQPILHQVGMLGEKYEKWIHSFPTTDHTVKMFTNDTIENLTKCPWYVPLVFWIPIMLIECAHYVQLMGGIEKLNAIVILYSFVLGMLLWSLFEYSLHRYVFHLETTGYYANIFHFLIHGHHHITPMDFDRLVFPPAPALILGAPFWYGMPKLMGIEHGYPCLVGFLIGYLCYDMTHFWIHHGVPKGTFLKQQKRRHVYHHYFKPTVNFGISSPLFDYVFGTISEPDS